MRSHLRESQVLAERDIECDCVSQSGDPESGGQRDGRQIAIRTGQWSGGNPSTIVSAGNSSAVLLQNRLVFASAAVEGRRVRISVFLKRIRIGTWTWTLTWTRDWEGISKGVQGQNWGEHDGANDAPSILFSVFCSTHCT